MLTRLEVDGFKNLNGLDVRFGPFTCVAGPNGAGKSNLFDAIAFLSALADRPLMEAALAVRGGESRRGDVRSLFTRTGRDVADRMRFAAEMVIREKGEDALGQQALASMTFLRYELELRYRPDPAVRSMGTLELTREQMTHINLTEAKARLGFPHKRAWRESVVRGRRTSPYISTEPAPDGGALISLHADSKGGGGRPRQLPAQSLPRTMLSSVNNAAEHRTLVLARQEMMSWTQLQLEPSALRAPDSLNAPTTPGPHGEHLPATLFALARREEADHKGGAADAYARVANRLSELIEDVHRLSVDVDEKRQLLNVVLTDRAGTEHFASALSDGTLRFLALAVMDQAPDARSLVCLEEPENGMHPLRIPAVIELLGDLAVDVDSAVDEDNPLRQVIINTHSPPVVACVHDDALLVAEVAQTMPGGVPQSRLALRHLPDTWRAEAAPDEPCASRGNLLRYLNPIGAMGEGNGHVGSRRVMDRKDLQLPLPWSDPPGIPS